MKICKHCECINETGVNRCENCGRPLDKCREISKEEIVAEDRRIIRRKRLGRRIFACISLVAFAALYVVAAAGAFAFGPPENMNASETVCYVSGWILAPVLFVVWFLSVVIPEKLYKAHYNVDSFLTQIDLFFEGYDVDRADLQPNFIFDIRYKIGLFFAYVIPFILTIIYISAAWQAA